jgi:predicted enzyme related to lactoylglutathione lyase
MGLGLPDLRSVSKKIEGAGGKIVSGPQDVEYGKF